MQIEIDERSGFCHGVTTAINKAEAKLQAGGELFCLGDIVHNGREVERLQQMGLKTVDHTDFALLSGVRVLLRAHGEPPETYLTAERNGITLVDATCPVVLQLQRRIKNICIEAPDAQVVIYGKQGLAEVVGLVGQTQGKAIVIQSVDETDKLDFNRDIYLFSQTTMPLDGFHSLINHINNNISPTAQFRFFDTICRQVANRLPHIRDFAARHDIVIFVSGRKSSNGRMLFEACKRQNPQSHMVDSPDDIYAEWFANAKTVGICGATSTPKWLMEDCRLRVAELTKER